MLVNIRELSRVSNIGQFTLNIIGYDIKVIICNVWYYFPYVSHDIVTMTMIYMIKFVTAITSFLFTKSKIRKKLK